MTLGMNAQQREVGIPQHLAKFSASTKATVNSYR